MPVGYLVTLGNGEIDTGDQVSNGATTTFTGSYPLGSGSVIWSNGTGSTLRSGIFYLGDDGNVYFVPNVATPIPPGSSGDTASISSFTPATYDDSDGSDDGVITTGAGNDTIYGGTEADGAGGENTDSTTPDDTISSGDGNDIIYAGTGDDSVTAGAGDDSIIGGAGDDWIDAGSGNNTVDAGEGNDTVFGGSDDDVITGGEGADSISGLSGNDDLQGWADNDTIYGDVGDDSIQGGFGDDSLFGGIDNDTVRGGSGQDYVDGGGGDDRLRGGEGNDTIVGGLGNDNLRGDDGDDEMYGQEGDDSLYTDAGNDQQYGGQGDDTFISSDSSGNDTLVGGIDGEINGDSVVLDLRTDAVTINYSTNSAGIITAGSDTLSFSEIEGFLLTDQDDIVYGFNNNDDVEIDARDGNDSIALGGGNDTVRGEGGDDTLQAGGGDDYLSGGLGTNQLEGGAGADTLDGTGGGYDYATYINSSAAVNVNLSDAATETGGEAQGDTLMGIEQVDGSQFNDTLTANDDGLELKGWGGDDTITGGAGEDFLRGGDGDDSIMGGAGADVLDGDAGADTIFGGDGNDTITGGDGDDLIGTNSGDNVVDGGAGNDIIFLAGGVATAEGGAGNDFITTATSGGTSANIDGGSGNDTLFGGADDDTIAGGSDDDELYGEAGNDTLSGGAGDDTLSGGTGDDTFVIVNGSGNDTITDFDIGDDNSDGFTNDQLDVSGFLRADGLTPISGEDVVVSDDGFGNALLTFPGGDTIVLQGVTPAQMTGQKNLYSSGVPCFVLGTMVETPMGQRAVEDLQAGDMVMTADSGPQPLIWTGRRDLSADDLAAMPKLRPIELRAGALGNHTAIRVSPQHCFVMDDRLVRAKHLAETSKAHVVKAAAGVSYVHLMCAQHEIIVADGIETETFYPGPMAIAMMGTQDKVSLAMALPELFQAEVVEAYGPRARPVMRRCEALDFAKPKRKAIAAR